MRPPSVAAHWSDSLRGALALAAVAAFAAQALIFAAAIWRDRDLIQLRDLVKPPVCGAPV